METMIVIRSDVETLINVADRLPSDIVKGEKPAPKLKAKSKAKSKAK
jgi:hypothetical protein